MCATYLEVAGEDGLGLTGDLTDGRTRVPHEDRSEPARAEGQSSSAHVEVDRTTTRGEGDQGAGARTSRGPRRRR